MNVVRAPPRTAMRRERLIFRDEDLGESSTWHPDNGGKLSAQALVGHATLRTDLSWGCTLKEKPGHF